DVCDRGGGMTETVLASALLPFYSTKRGGTGLGLALVREIAEAHGGRVALSNRDVGGLHVSLILPPWGAAVGGCPFAPFAGARPVPRPRRNALSCHHVLRACAGRPIAAVHPAAVG